ncbi:MAG: hypothetical protein QOH26_1097 [Actinomycetota bacterium]|nr:hypothetical protein [Actinomycetota bacterium]
MSRVAAVVLLGGTACTGSDREPAIAHPSTTTTERTTVEGTGALSFGFGRVPEGSVEICPEGPFADRDLVAAKKATADLLRAANAGGRPDTQAMWDLMDVTLQEAHGSYGEFVARVDAVRFDANDVYAEWRTSDRAYTDDKILLVGDLISLRCGEETRSRVVQTEMYFPDFEGVSGGAGQLQWLSRPDGPRLWFIY